MAIKDLYKEVEAKKMNEVEDKTVSMPLDDFIDEHKNLIEVLRNGSPAEREAEAKKQEAELAEETGETADDNEDAEEVD